MVKPQELIDLTKAMVRIPSISESKNSDGAYNENLVADYIADYFTSHNIPVGFLPTRDGRKCVYVKKAGATKRTIVLLGHLDVVGVEDYEGVDPFDTAGNDDTFLYGRGSGDMKSGLAVGMGLMRDLWEQQLETNLFFIATPDEENASEGVIAAGKFLQTLKQKEGLDYIGLINLDCGLEDPSSNSRSAVAGGAVGKLLPCFYVVGRSAHASDPFSGIASSSIGSEIVRLLDSNVEFSDKNQLTNELTPPPTCLKATDLKDSYDVQLPIKTFLYFNYLTFHENPKQVLGKMVGVAKQALGAALKDNDHKYAAFCKKQGRAASPRAWSKTVNVYSYEEVERKALRQNPSLPKAIAQLLDESSDEDPRDRNVKIVAKVASYAGLEAPYVVCFFSPPYYPSSYADNDSFVKTVKQVMDDFGDKEGIAFDIKDFCEGISDMNYMQLDRQVLGDTKLYTKNNPLERAEPSVDLDVIADISMPITQIGPYTLFPHHRDEKVEIKYTFEILPRLLKEVIEAVQR